MSFVPAQKLQMTAYKELLAAQLDPEIQISAEYNTTGLVDQIDTGTSVSGAANGEYFATSGTGATDVSAIFSKIKSLAVTAKALCFASHPDLMLD